MTNLGKMYEVTIVNNGFMVFIEKDQEVHVFTNAYTLSDFFEKKAKEGELND